MHASSYTNMLWAYISREHISFLLCSQYIHVVHGIPNLNAVCSIMNLLIRPNLHQGIKINDILRKNSEKPGKYRLFFFSMLYEKIYESFQSFQGQTVISKNNNKKK